MGIEAVDRRGLDQIERLALGVASGKVDQPAVASFLETDEMGEGAADLAGTDQRNLGTRHGERPLGTLRMRGGGEPGGTAHSPFRCCRSSRSRRIKERPSSV